MSTELKDRLLRIEAMCKGNSGVCKDIAFEARMALQAVDSQPFTVIAPPLEWGEWRDSPDGINRWKRSKCGRYDIHQDMFENEFGSYLDRNDMSLDITCTEQEAEQVCQIHLQYKITQALEGCNVIPYRDPQGLVDIVKQALTYCESKIARVESGFSDERFIEIMGEKFTQALKAWEDGK